MLLKLNDVWQLHTLVQSHQDCLGLLVIMSASKDIFVAYGICRFQYRRVILQVLKRCGNTYKLKPGRVTNIFIAILEPFFGFAAFPPSPLNDFSNVEPLALDFLAKMFIEVPFCRHKDPSLVFFWILVVMKAGKKTRTCCKGRNGKLSKTLIDI